MTENYTIKDVTNDLSFALSLTKLFETDSQGYWIDSGTEKRYLHKLDAADEGKEIVVYQDPIPSGDIYFFNPYSEGLGKKSPATQMYYKTIRYALNLNFSMCAMHLIKEILKHKDDSDYKVSPTIIRMSAVNIDKKTPLIDIVDEKLVDEFKFIFDKVESDFMFVPYMNAQMAAVLKIDALTNPNWDEQFGKDIRKKSLVAFKAVVMSILEIKCPTELSSFTVKYSPSLKTSARFYTTLSVYLNIYSKFNDIIPDAFSVNGVPSDSEAIDLDELSNVIERSSYAYAIAKHMIQPVSPKQNPIDVRSSGYTTMNPLDGSGMNRSDNKFYNSDPSKKFAPEVVGAPRLFNSSPMAGQSKFAPEVIGQQNSDPFALAVRPAFGSSQGYGSYSNPFSSNNQNNSGGFGFNTNAPSNFNSPTAFKRYF